MTRGWWLCLVAACGPPTTIPKEEFPAAAADAICARSRECARGQFDANYFGMSDCLAEVERDFGDLVALADSNDCDYDAGEAAALWVETHEMSCEDFYDGEYLSTEVWSDCEVFDDGSGGRED